MSYQRAKQLVGGNIPPWQKVLDAATSFGKEAQGFSQGFADAYTFGATNLAEKAAEKLVPLPEEAESKYQEIVNPKTSGIGEALGFGTGAFGQLAVNMPKSISHIIKNAEIGKVQKVQKAFGPWVKKYTGEYGKAFRGGVKDVIKKQGTGAPAKEVKRAFDPLRRSDTYKDLPSKTQNAIEKVYSPNAKPRDVLNAANRLRKSPVAKKFDESGNLVRETGKKLKNIVKKQSPEFAKVDREYGEFSGVKKVMEKFKPGAKGQGEFGTQSGTKLLRNIDKAEPGDISAMERFGKETGINIVGPAKLASKARGIGSLIKKSAPWAGGGGAGYLLAKKLLGNQGGYNNYNQ